MTKAGEKIIRGLEDALAYSRGDKSKGTANVYVTIAISEREGGGIRVRALGEMREFYLSGSSKADVFADLGPALQEILATNHGISWVKDA